MRKRVVRHQTSTKLPRSVICAQAIWHILDYLGHTGASTDFEALAALHDDVKPLIEPILRSHQCRSSANAPLDDETSDASAQDDET